MRAEDGVVIKWWSIMQERLTFKLNQAVVITHHGWESSQKPKILYTCIALKEQLVHISQPRDQSVSRRLALVGFSAGHKLQMQQGLVKHQHGG